MRWGVTAARRGSSGARTSRARMLGRSVVVAGFAAMSWGALSGVAFALEGSSADVPAAETVSTTQQAPQQAPQQGPQDADGAHAHGVLPGLTHALGELGKAPVLDALPISVPDSAPAAESASPAAAPAQEQVPPQDERAAAPGVHPVAGVVSGLVGGVGTVTHTVTHPVAGAAEDPSPTVPGSPASPGAPRTTTLLGAVAGTVRETVDRTAGVVRTTAETARTTTSAVTAGVGSALTVTPDRPSGSILTGVLDSLGVSDSPLGAVVHTTTGLVSALPLPSVPLVTKPAGILRPLLPAHEPAAGGDAPQSGASQPAAPGGSDTDASSGSSAPAAPVVLPDLPSAGGTAVDESVTGHGADSTLPAAAVLLPASAALGSRLLPALAGGLRDGSTSSAVDGPAGGHAGDVASSILSSLRGAQPDAGADDGVLPIPTGPQAPGGHGGGAAGGAQAARGVVDSLRLPDTLRDGSAVSDIWSLRPAPTFDPGFSPD